MMNSGSPSTGALRAPRPPTRSKDESTFGPAHRLLPRHLRDDVRALYEAGRSLDDLVDAGRPEAAPRVEAVERWARGEPPESPESRALADLSRRHPVSRVAVLEFCAAMRHDLEGASIETEEELALYCRRAGGSPVVLLAQVLGDTNAETDDNWVALGAAMQLTNILRDIDEDMACGRLYIPRSTIERFGPPLPGAREALLADQIARADLLFAEGRSAVRSLKQGRRGMALAAALYSAILRQIERDGLGRLPGRSEVNAWRVRCLDARYRLLGR